MTYDDISIRNAFGEAAYEYTMTHKNVFCIGADTTKSMGLGKLEEECPERCINVGICEQTAMLVGAGIAASGGKAFVTSYAPFTSMRMLEQVRTFCAYPRLDVKIVSGMSGLSGSSEGVTHQGLEDVSILRGIANMVIAVPADEASVRVITREIADYVGPVYLRLGRNANPKVFGEDYTFKIGRANVMKSSGRDLTIIFNGVVTSRVLQAEEILASLGIEADLIEMPCVKPIDQEAVIHAAKKTGAILTVEDNNIIGGLGSAVAEVVGENWPVIIKRIGIQDCYAETGEESMLLDKYGISVETIVEEAGYLVKKRVKQ